MPWAQDIGNVPQVVRELREQHPVSREGTVSILCVHKLYLHIFHASAASRVQSHPTRYISEHSGSVPLNPSAIGPNVSFKSVTSRAFCDPFNGSSRVYSGL